MMRILKLFWMTTVAMAGLMLCSAAFAQSSKKVLVVPFTINASDNLAYMQKGISQMLSSRLSWEGKVEVVQPTSTDTIPTDPVQYARMLGADYVIVGSLTVLGESVSTDAKVLDAVQNKQVFAFGRVGRQQAEVIDHVDALAAEINSQIFGRALSQSTRSPAPIGSARTQPESNVYQHPEKLITQPEEGGRYEPEGGKGDFVPGAPLVTRSNRLEFQVQGVTAGDIDGDGLSEVICTGPATVMVYRMANGRLAKMSEFEGIGNYIGVDAVDVNANGKAEIFVTNFDDSDSQAASFVLEWDGRKLVRTAENLNWYFRAIEWPHRGNIMVGQRQGVSDRFSEGIFEMAWKAAGGYEPAQRLPLPRNLNIYGFVYGAVRSPQETEVAAYNSGGFVQLLNNRGGEEWTTSERFGGSGVFIEFPDPTDTSQREYLYLSPRIHLFDLDEDGIQEIFVVKNNDIAGVLERVRLFKNGSLQGLKWDELGMTPIWRTRDLAKYVSDFAIADLDKDGQPEVVAAVVQKDRGALSKGRSFLAVFKLVKPAPEKK